MRPGHSTKGTSHTPTRNSTACLGPGEPGMHTQAAALKKVHSQAPDDEEAKNQAKAGNFSVFRKYFRDAAFKKLEHRSDVVLRVRVLTTAKHHESFQIICVIKEQKKLFLMRIMHWKKQNKHAMRGYMRWFNTFILTQAGRRRATPFVKLVSSQVKKIEK